jgi:tyrosyl-tRNA synthetase
MPKIKPSNYDILTVLIESGCINSRSEGKRVVLQNGVKINKESINDPLAKVKIGDVVQKGKTFFIKIY